MSVARIAIKNETNTTPRTPHRLCPFYLKFLTPPPPPIPLSPQHHVHPCPVCALVVRSSEQHPPVLPLPHAGPISLSGRWVSQRCETRPSVLFLTREFTFAPEHHSWVGVYRHYSDPTCTRPTFALRASGHYAQTGPSGKVAGGTEFVFKIGRAHV